MHDNTLTNDNRDKFIQIAERYGQLVKFYNVEELFAEKLEELKGYFQSSKYFRTIAMFYRLFAPNIFSRDIEKIIYLDCDIVVNLDIAELWQIEIEDYPLAAVTEVANGVEIAKFSRLVRDGFAKAENYFNSGVLLMNLKVLRNEEANIAAGIKFRSEHPEYNLFDQEILNYCFETRTLKLPVKYNRLVKQMRNDGVFSVSREIYHYAYMKVSLTPDMSDPFNYLWMSYFIKTPWFGLDTVADAIGNYPPSQKKYSVSVIIPLYNAEKYIGECLDSLLLQRFQDFEVIVVDDCSTDTSFAIAESYMSKFNGRLRLTKTEKNSGSGGAPRNKGLLISGGEYIQFLDADDMLTKTALEEMYTLAKEYDADVVYCERYFISDDDGSNVRAKSHPKERRVDIPTFDTDDLKKRVQEIIEERFLGNICNKFVKRNLIMENEIFIPNVKTSEDNIWTQGLIFYAKKLIRVPNIVYIYRQSANSSQRLEKTSKQKITFWLNPVLLGLKALDKLMSRHEFFIANPSYRYAVLKKFIDVRCGIILKYTSNLNEEDVYSTIKDAFGDKLGEYDTLVSALSVSLCTALHDVKKAPANDGKLREFFNYLTSDIVLPHFTMRVDINLTPSDKGDFQILSISDNKAEVSKPAGLQKGGTLYKIQSDAGRLELIIKSNADGKLRFYVKGISIYDVKDKTKRIPHWICYTKFTINDNVIFNTLTPAWHDKPYIYDMEVKAGKELKILFEWLTHKTDVFKTKVTALPPESKVMTSPPSKPEPKIKTPTTSKPEPKVATLPPLYKPESLVPRKFNPFITARIDAKFVSTMGDFQILSISDDKAKITKPGWFQHNGIGYIVQSSHGKLTFIAKATADGQINLNFRGMDIRNPDDWTKGIANRIPYWIDYTKLTVNGKNIFSTRTPAWCDEPYKYAIDVKANEEVTVVIEWQPHNDT